MIASGDVVQIRGVVVALNEADPVSVVGGDVVVYDVVPPGLLQPDPVSSVPLDLFPMTRFS